LLLLNACLLVPRIPHGQRLWATIRRWRGAFCTKTTHPHTYLPHAMESLSLFWSYFCRVLRAHPQCLCLLSISAYTWNWEFLSYNVCAVDNASLEPPPYGTPTIGNLLTWFEQPKDVHLSSIDAKTCSESLSASHHLDLQACPFQTTTVWPIVGSTALKIMHPLCDGVVWVECALLP
jgi:hypothetical protein